jgi:hypothetical protein
MGDLAAIPTGQTVPSPSRAFDAAQLATSAEGLQQFFHVCPVGLAETDARGHVLVINPAAVSLLTPAMPRPDFRELGPVLDRLAPDLTRAMRTDGPTGPVGSAVACTFSTSDTWVGLQVLRLEPDRFMIVVHDVTTEQRLARREAQAALEINDTVVQTLVAAETALDLGRTDLGRSLVGEASKASRAWIGQQLVASGGARPGAVRREGPSRPQREAGQPGRQDDTR